MGALGTSYAILSVPALAAMAPALSIGGIAATLIGFISVAYSKPEYHTLT
jgi:hypothetical protein